MKKIHCTIRPFDCSHSRPEFAAGYLIEHLCGIKSTSCQYSDTHDYDPVKKVIDVSIAPRYIEPLKCGNCGHTKITEEMETCPVCRWLLHPTPEQEIARNMKRVKWGCYKAGFYEYTKEYCETHECKNCNHNSE